MTCPDCGTENALGANFCNGCGTRLAAGCALGLVGARRGLKPLAPTH
jgi:hypothetical protein